MPKLIPNEVNGVVEAYTFWCPACNAPHSFGVVSPRYGRQVPVWQFDGNMESPTFSPSLRLSYTNPQTKQQVTTCHLFLTNGELVYQGDSGHDMKGKVVPLPEFPS